MLGDQLWSSPKLEGQSVAGATEVTAVHGRFKHSFLIGDGLPEAFLECQLSDEDEDLQDIGDWCDSIDTLYQQGRLKVSGSRTVAQSFVDLFVHWQLPVSPYP